MNIFMRYVGYTYIFTRSPLSIRLHSHDSHFHNCVQCLASHERTRGWFLVGSPVPMLLIMFGYHRLITKIGPAIMKSRQPFKIDKIVQIYNLAQVIICGWLAFEGFRLTYGPNGHYNLHCQPMDLSLSPLARRIALLTWIYYMIKVLDLFDTIFFVMRKKFNQVSFLHLYHHMGILILGYMGSTFYPDGHGFIIIPLNSLVHCFMYFYYFLSNYSSKYKNNVWWKKHITQLQIAQFVILIIQATRGLLASNCGYPYFPLFLIYPQLILILKLFGDFYYKTYINPKPTQKTS
ncbi:elongation of very long chain fatty acids protein, putative [Pediculus humanus corporis]|uniref:Elongation of very long chain fatty acids protein n=1 Tax=Pediculus humanus subsp. corporis TaxID=121224 RepID=E0VQR3_PEDHC|nr:elongation of very long chain fatty acids protein, putative [Pediculus humanus corporis]EEB15718.1 elongation of very long chain fatty acids protein, putative [Pediculus humanus corporis]